MAAFSNSGVILHRTEPQDTSKVKGSGGLLWRLILFCLLFGLSVVGVLADEADSRRVGISLSIFPRIVAVDNQFRDKLSVDRKAYLFFVYDKDEEYAHELADLMQKNNDNIGGMYVTIKVVSVADGLQKDDLPTAMFIVERLSDAQLNKVMKFANDSQRLLFSPFTGDVERGVTVGISVTNRVKPYFNLASLRQSKISINALLMKMSKRYE
jgi:hypothetical protein